PVAGSEEVKEVSVSAEGLTVVNQEKSSGKLDLKEAEVVVSAGRGMKGPENWGMIEELANVLGAATACSKPVSDIGWRSHSEHVGQTGKAIAPNLYIAVGISGAIQHLAGVNSSKTIVVINNDAEAPFFKSADYGVVGDAFQI
ncbi:UNVERIFIED_CONTAM: electron transfer flavoprotein subunit alpha/FixB family protein, partial [Bacillus thuringiensis]